MSDHEPRRFWRDAFALRGSATPQVLRRVVQFGLIAAVIYVYHVWPRTPPIVVEVAPYEFAGAALGLLLVLRTNAGYDRWWEGRKLWGGIVNQSRDLAIAALAYGPPDPRWRAALVRWTAAFGHVTRRSLRGERNMPEVAELLGDDQARQIAAAEHMPTFVNRTIADQLRQARDRHGLDSFAFLQIDRARATLLDHLGGCERILSAPLPRVYSIHIRRFIFLYLATLPLPLVDRIGWLTPLLTMFVAYPILALDQIGIELENPFSIRRMGHLPLDEITAKIETNLLALLEDGPYAPLGDRIPPHPAGRDDGQGRAGMAAAGDATAPA
jgi:putative membrane protein